ncbi:MAG: hypothetical protein LBT36_03345 [Oscillospiraceae bacterium]|jgi:tetratricopeptide (TPR) repeat protein|nr:hypothetical protein [Oscillospiraceae bacterium]
MRARISALLLALALLLGAAACGTSEPTAAELLARGEAYLQDLDYTEALVQFLALIDLEPMNPRGYAGAAEAYLGQDKTSRAVRILEKGIDATDGDEELADLLARLQADAEPEIPAETPDAAPPDDWKPLYADTLLAAQAYAAAADWAAHDYNGAYPAYLSAAQIADLNFDGVPELLIFGDGAGASESLRIYAVIGGAVEKIFQDWCSPSDVTLYRRASGAYAYGFISANGEMDSTRGTVYLMTRETPMDASPSLADAARLADFSAKYEYDYDEETYEETLISAAYTFNGQTVSEAEYARLFSDLLAEYEPTDYIPATLELWGLSGAPKTADDYAAFLDSYTPEPSAVTKVSAASPPAIPTPTAAIALPAPETRVNLADTMTDAELRALNIFFSNFSETRFPDFDIDAYDVTSLLAFAVHHDVINNPGRFVIAYGGEPDAALAPSYVENAMLKYFGVSGVTHQSAGAWVTYSDGKYHWHDVFEGAPWFAGSQVAEFFDNGDGTYSALLEDYTDGADYGAWLSGGGEINAFYQPQRSWSGFGGVFARSGYHTATVAPHTYDGKQTYKLLTYRRTAD